MVRRQDTGVNRWQWVPGTNGLTTPAAPKVSELAAATTVNLTPYLVAGNRPVTVNASETNDERSMADTANGATPTFDNYSGQILAFRDYDDAGVETAQDLLDIFPRKGIFGWIVQRSGLLQATPFAVGQVVDVFLFLTDNAQTGGDNTGSSLKATIPLLPQGSMYQNRALVA
jgi:hypothetical protein